MDFDFSFCLQHVIVPRRKYCNLTFVQAIFLDDKKWLFKQQCKSKLTVPELEELSVANTWKMAMTVPTFKDYIPDEWDKPIKAERDFYYQILSALAPNWLAALIEECYTQRKKNKDARQTNFDKTLAISSMWADTLLEGDYTDSKLTTA